MDPTDPRRVAAALNEDVFDGFGRTLGLRYVSATVDEVVAEVNVDDRHRQPHGVVHGGVYASVIESVASVGAAMVAATRGQSVVGLENHTSFLRAARQGKLVATAKPINRGRRSQVWEGEVRDDNGKLLAAGRVRLLCLDGEADLAGQAIPKISL